MLKLVKISQVVLKDKIIKSVQELIQSDLHQAPNTKGKDRQINKAATKLTDGNSFSKRWELYYPNLTEYIINLHNC